MLNLNPTQLLLMTPGLLAAITFHEYAHAVTASFLGDPTPRLTGRLTLNPLKHIDWIGLLMLVTVGFGWAKPVQINAYYFNDQRRGMVLVSLAGPAANILLALVGLVVVKVVLPGGSTGRAILSSLVWFNAVLAVFNILPIPPLDGSRILTAVARGAAARLVARLEEYGWLVLILLLWSGVLGRILRPMVNGVVLVLDRISSVVVGF